MKSICKYCGNKHDKYTLDILSATKIPKEFCSDFCHNLALMDSLPTDQKEFAYIKCTNSHLFKGQKFANVGGEVVKIEYVFEDGIEVSKVKVDN